jgi:hypothetical protein
VTDNNIEKYGLNAVCTHLGCVVPWVGVSGSAGQAGRGRRGAAAHGKRASSAAASMHGAPLQQRPTPTPW